MPEPDYVEQLRVLRPVLKGHIRQTRNLLALLAQLEREVDDLAITTELRELDQRIALGGIANGNHEDGITVG